MRMRRSFGWPFAVLSALTISNRSPDEEGIVTGRAACVQRVPKCRDECLGTIDSVIDRRARFDIGHRGVLMPPISEITAFPPLFIQ